MKRKNTDISRKREQEKEMVTQMIQLYCRGNHHTGSLMCSECQKLAEYASMRSDKCPFMETKTFCSNCKVHSKRTFSFAGKQLSNVTAASICTFAMAHLPSKFPNHMK